MASSSVIESFEQYNLLSENERKVFDDFYWLRFLEVEVNETQVFQGSISFKKNCKMDKMGQSIFTVTKRLRREPDEDFGFESNIVWSKPCFINGIRQGSPACLSHLEPGDFIIFIDKVNIVDMNKTEILSLLNKSDALTLEVFRRASVKPPIVRPSISIISSKTTTKNQDSIQEENENSIESIPTVVPIVEVKKTRLVSKSSTESKKKHLTFSKDESITSGSIDSQRSLKLLTSLLQSERQFNEAMNFGHKRYIAPLGHRKDLLSSKEHDILFKNIEGVKAVIDSITHSYGDHRDNLEVVIQSYKNHMTDFAEAYEAYFATMKTADCIIVDKTHHPEFIKFIGANPSIPANQPLFHNFVHKPLEFYNGLQKNFQIILAQQRIDSQDYQDLTYLLKDLQTIYGQATAKAAESKTEVKPLLRNLESRLVFTKCKPFKLDIPERQWIFGGDLIRIEEKNYMEKPTYTLLFNDIILFATINRDRVLFITEEPINLKSVVETFFNIRKKEKEFRLTIETNPNYKDDHSPTSTHCTPDLIKRSPMRQSKRRNIYLRAQSEEIKKVWQNLISQQVFNVNAISTSNSSNHIDSPGIVLVKNPSTQTDIFTNDILVQTPNRKTYNYAHANSNQLNLKSQNAFDMGDSLEKIIDEDHMKTPDTPSINLSSLNDKIQKSLSSMTFSSARNINSDYGDSEYGDIFNGFDSADISFANDVKECMFMQNDPFFADET